MPSNTTRVEMVEAGLRKLKEFQAKWRNKVAKHDASSQTDLEDQRDMQKDDNAFKHDSQFWVLCGDTMQPQGKCDSKGSEESNAISEHQKQMAIHDHLEPHFKITSVL